MEYYVITFNSMHDAIKAEKLTANLGGAIIPAPSEISADCGFALRINSLELIKNISFESASVYKVTGRGSGKVVEKVF